MGTEFKKDAFDRLEDPAEEEIEIAMFASDGLVERLRKYHPEHDVAGIDDRKIIRTQPKKRVWPEELR